jgi:signal peptidase I
MMMRRPVIAASCLLGFAALSAAMARRHFVVVQVNGRSMLPTLRSGDRVLVRRVPAARLTAGAIVVIRAHHRGGNGGGPPPAYRGWVIKRVAALPGDLVPGPVRAATAGISVVPGGMLVLMADNPNGTDSRRWGLVPADGLLGVVIARLPAADGHAYGETGPGRRGQCQSLTAGPGRPLSPSPGAKEFRKARQ